MKIKRFFASDMRQAIRTVREEHGPDAVILSSRKVEGGMEIISAVDYDQNLVTQMIGTSPAQSAEDVSDADSVYAPTGYAFEPPETPALSSPQAEVVWSQDPAIVEMRHELESLRGLLHNQLSQLAWGDYSRREPLKAQLVRRLVRIGLSPRLARELAARVPGVKDPEQAWSEVLRVLAASLTTTDNDIVSHGGVIALIGPTGVGKTTTAAKLAARFAQRHGRRHVALISADSFRIGAQRQLMSFGQILGVQTVVAATGQELLQRLRELDDKKLVLIDTAGMSQRDVRLGEQIAVLGKSPTVKNYLVMSATAERAVLEQVVQAYGRVRLHACILTKLDEAVSLGASLSVALATHLPLAYVGDGQRVPEDIHPARVSRLISRAVALAQTHEKAQAQIDTQKTPPPSKVMRTKLNAHV